MTSLSNMKAPSSIWSPSVSVAILDAAPHLLSGQHLVVFTDNVNTVELFNLLSALPAFNWMFILVADAVLDQGFDFQVFHVPGIHNQVADSLSCFAECPSGSLTPRDSHLCLSTPSTYIGSSYIMSLRPSAWARQPSCTAWPMEHLIVEHSIIL